MRASACPARWYNTSAWSGMADMVDQVTVISVSLARVWWTLASECGWTRIRTLTSKANVNLLVQHLGLAQPGPAHQGYDQRAQQCLSHIVLPEVTTI